MSRHKTTLVLETERFDAATREFLGRLLPRAVDAAVRKIAFDVVDETARGLNGLGGLPKRIDTGRLRAGWRVALEDGGLPVPGSAAGSPESLTGDGEADLERHYGHLVGVTVVNRVEYARHVEEGTVHMEPGKHLERALRVVRLRFPRDPTFSRDVSRAWRGLP